MTTTATLTSIPRISLALPTGVGAAFAALPNDGSVSALPPAPGSPPSFFVSQSLNIENADDSTTLTMRPQMNFSCTSTFSGTGLSFLGFAGSAAFTRPGWNTDRLPVSSRDSSRRDRMVYLLLIRSRLA